MGDGEGINIGSLYYKLPSSEEFLPVGNVSDAHFDLHENTEDNVGEWVEHSTESISFDVKVSDVHVNFLNCIRCKQRIPRKLKKKMKKKII